MIIRCSQCGANFEASAELRLTRCPFCDTALAIDTRGSIIREMMLPTISAEEAPHHLRRFMAGTETVAGLDREAEIESIRLEYFPFWAFSVRRKGEENLILSPAAPSSLQGLQRLILPPGETRGFSQELSGDAPIVEAEIPVDTARKWLKLVEDGIDRVFLYHLPIYRMSYSWKGRHWQAAVDAVSGRVFPASFPAKAEAPFYGVAALALIVFGIEGFIFSNLFVKAGVYLISSIPIIAVAWLVSRKV